MDDPFTPKKPFGPKDYKLERMILSPKQWESFHLKETFQWKMERFERSRASKIPSNKKGVYSFVARPEVADHPACAYLLYIGKAEKQSLRERFNQYFNHKTETSRRPHISKMLLLWPKHLWFCFSPIGKVSKIEAAEDALISAFLPPFNHSYKGVVAKHVKFILT